jgi:MFS family permease
VIAAIPIGLLIDRVSRVRLLLALGLIGALASFLAGWARSFTTLFLSRCLTGLAVSAIWATVLSLLADLYAPNQRGRATMMVAFGGLGGMSAAFALGGVLLTLPEAGADSWRIAMLWLSAPLALTAFLPILMQEPSRAGIALQARAPWQVYADIWRYRAMVLPLTVGFVLVGLADGAAVIWAAPTLSRAFALPPAQVGGIMAAVLLVSGVVSPILGGTLADLAERAGGPHRTVAVLTVVLLLTIPTGLFPVARSVSSTSILLSLFLILGGAFNVAVQTLTTIIMPNDLRGSCLSLMLAVSLVFAFGLAPVLVGQLSDAMGNLSMIGRALSIVCVVSCAIGTVVFYMGRRSFPVSVAQEQVGAAVRRASRKLS